jgi:hypothetical protein
MYSIDDRHNRRIHCEIKKINNHFLNNFNYYLKIPTKELCEFREQCLCNYVASGLRKNLVFALLGRWAIPVAEIRVGIFLDC